MRYETTKDGPVLIVRMTRAGRFGVALKRVFEILPWSCGIAALFFGIEYVGGTITKTAQPSWVYLMLGVLLGGAVAFMFGFSRGLRNELWAFDVSEGVVAWESRMPWGQMRSVQAPLADLKSLERTEDGLWMTFVTGDREALCKAEEGEVAAIAAALRQHLGTRVEFTDHGAALES